jgi:hypothetical protein
MVSKKALSDQSSAFKPEMVPVETSLIILQIRLKVEDGTLF